MDTNGEKEKTRSELLVNKLIETVQDGEQAILRLTIENGTWRKMNSNIMDRIQEIKGMTPTRSDSCSTRPCSTDSGISDQMLSLSRAKSDDMRHASRFTVVVSGFPGWFLCDIAAAKSLKEYISKYRANSMNRILNDLLEITVDSSVTETSTVPDQGSAYFVYHSKTGAEECYLFFSATYGRTPKFMACQEQCI